MEDRPLILTLQLSEEAFRFFDSLRQQHFPPERNFLSAHLTLFHHLPANENAVREEIRSLSNQQTTIQLSVTNVVSIGNGVAFKIESSLLQQIHRDLQMKWQHWLIPQDKQKLWPHITVQNKTTAAVAAKTLDLLKQNFQPFTAYGIGLNLWSYEGGPWKFIEAFAFKVNQSF